MAHPAGRKIGFTNRGIWQKYGVHEPIWGFVYDENLIFSRKNKDPGETWTTELAGLPLQGLEVRFE